MLSIHGKLQGQHCWHGAVCIEVKAMLSLGGVL